MPQKLLSSVVFTVGVVLSTVTMGQLREWTDSTGKHKTQAEFVEWKDDVVVLRKIDSKIISLPLKRLSDADQDFVHRHSLDLELERYRESGEFELDPDLETVLAALPTSNLWAANFVQDDLDSLDIEKVAKWSKETMPLAACNGRELKGFQQVFVKRLSQALQRFRSDESPELEIHLCITLNAKSGETFKAVRKTLGEKLAVVGDAKEVIDPKSMPRGLYVNGVKVYAYGGYVFG